MFGLENPIHLLFVLVVLLLVFGARRLPEMGKSLGSGLRGFKESLSGEPTDEHAGVPVALAAASTDAAVSPRATPAVAVPAERDA